jgi:hypothetical protein
MVSHVVIVSNQVYDLLGMIARLTRSSPGWVVHSDNWRKVVNSAKEVQVNLCRTPEGKNHYNALYRTCTVTQLLSQVTFGPSTTTAEPDGPSEVDGFQEQRGRKRTSSGDKEAKRRAGPHTSTRCVHDPLGFIFFF